MDLFEAISKRYCYRGEFTDVPVPRADLEKIVQAGIQAPSACNAQVATFVIVDDAKLLAEISQIINSTVCKTAHAMIACVVDPRPVYKDTSYPREDCAAAVENMFLAITALGYATVWIDGMLCFNEVAERIADLLDVPTGRKVQVLLPIGVAAAPGKQMEKLPFAQRAWFNRHGGS